MIQTNQPGGSKYVVRGGSKIVVIDKTRKLEEPEEKIIKEYKKVTRNGKTKKVDVSKFTWCINRLREMKSGKAVNFILRRFAELPFLADLFFKYLQTFANKKCVKDKIADFLSSQDNIYEWQEMWLLLTLSKAKKLDDEHLKVVREIIKKKDKHWAPRVAAILALGKLGDNTDRISLKSLYSNEDNHYIKRAIAVSVHNLPKSARNKFYSEIEKDSHDMERLVKYLRQEDIETI